MKSRTSRPSDCNRHNEEIAMLRSLAYSIAETVLAPVTQSTQKSCHTQRDEGTEAAILLPTPSPSLLAGIPGASVTAPAASLDTNSSKATAGAESTSTDSPGTPPCSPLISIHRRTPTPKQLRTRRHGVFELGDGLLLVDKLITQDFAFLQSEEVGLIVSPGENPRLKRGREVQRLFLPSKYCYEGNMLWSLYNLFLVHAKEARDSNKTTVIVSDAGMLLITLLHCIKDRGMGLQGALSRMGALSLSFSERLQKMLENCLSDLSSPPACKRYRMKMEKRGLNLAVRDDNCTPHPGKVILVQHAQQGVHLIHSGIASDPQEERAAREWAFTFDHNEGKHPKLAVLRVYPK